MIALVLCRLALETTPPPPPRDLPAHFTFHKDGDAGTFAVELAVDPSTIAGTTFTVASHDPAILFVAPHQRSASAAPVVFAGRYLGAGELAIVLHRERLAATPQDGEDVSLRAVFPERAPDDGSGTERALAAAEAADAERLLDLAPDDSFARYVVVRAQQRHGIFRAEQVPAFMAAHPRRPDLYDAFTGALAIQESLQLDELLNTEPREVPAVELHALTPPRLESHPFDAMRKGREPELADAVRYVPAEFWCAQFASMESLLELLDFARDWGTHLLAMYGAESADHDRRARYERQLALRTDPLLRPFYGLAVADVAVCGSDPFLTEGSDLTLILHARNRALCEAQLGRLRAERAAACDVQDQLESIGAHEVRVLRSADRAVSSYFTWDGDHAIITNCRTALERVLAVRADNSQSLAAALDFRYLASLAPVAMAQPDGTLFIGEAFVRRVVGPALKLAEARRVRCVATLRLIENAALLHRTEHGRAPERLDELVPGYLRENSIACPERGAFTLEHGHARCSAHGTLIALVPCLELPVARATTTEAREYDRFARRYNDYWRQYFDPIAIRMQLGNTVHVETTILPLIENSAYDTLQTWAGGTSAGPFATPPAGTILSLGARLDLHALLPGDAERRALERRHGVALDAAADRAFGPEADIALGDGDLRFHFRLDQYLSGLLAGAAGTDLYLAPVLASMSLPVAVRLAVRDRALAGQFVDQAESALVRETANTQVLRSAPRFERYALEPYRDVPVRVLSIEALEFRLRVFHALTEHALVVANQEEFLHRAIDACLDHGLPEGPLAHGRLELRRSAWERVTPALLQNYAEAGRQACHLNLAIATHVLDAARGADPAAARELERRSFARVGVCPEGGSYARGQDGLAECSVHGSLSAPRQPRMPGPDTALGRILQRLRSVRVALRFTPEGLVSLLEIERG